MIAVGACHPVLVSSRDHVLTAWWESLYKELGQAVKEVDPEGLLAMGAPAGEYADEVDRLASLVVRDDVSEQSILAVWETAFGTESQPSRRPDLLILMTQQLRQVQERYPRP